MRRQRDGTYLGTDGASRQDGQHCSQDAVDGRLLVSIDRYTERDCQDQKRVDDRDPQRRFAVEPKLTEREEKCLHELFL